MEELADVLYCPNLLKYAAQFMASHLSVSIALWKKKRVSHVGAIPLDFTFLVRRSPGRPYLGV